MNPLQDMSRTMKTSFSNPSIYSADCEYAARMTIASACILRAVLFWLLIVHLITPVLQSFRLGVERAFVELWGVKQTVNLSTYSKPLLPNAREKFCVTLCSFSVKFSWGIKGSQAEWCGHRTWNLLVLVNSQLVWLLSVGILKLPVEFIWVIKNTHTHTHTWLNGCIAGWKKDPVRKLQKH